MSIDLVIVFVIQNKFSFRYHLVFVGEKMSELFVNEINTDAEETNCWIKSFLFFMSFYLYFKKYNLVTS